MKARHAAVAVSTELSAGNHKRRTTSTLPPIWTGRPHHEQVPQSADISSTHHWRRAHHGRRAWARTSTRRPARVATRGRREAGALVSWHLNTWGWRSRDLHSERSNVAEALASRQQPAPSRPTGAAAPRRRQQTRGEGQPRSYWSLQRPLRRSPPPAPSPTPHLFPLHLRLSAPARPAVTSRPLRPELCQTSPRSQQVVAARTIRYRYSTYLECSPEKSSRSGEQSARKQTTVIFISADTWSSPSKSQRPYISRLISDQNCTTCSKIAYRTVAAT